LASGRGGELTVLPTSQLDLGDRTPRLGGEDRKGNGRGRGREKKGRVGTDDEGRKGNERRGRGKEKTICNIY